MNDDAGPYLTFLQPATDALIQAAGLKPGHVVLDIGTGFGDPALDAARAVAPEGKVVGVDLSEERLKQARQRARRHNLSNVEFQEMDALQLRFPDDSFDAVISRLVVVYYADPSPFLAEIRRVLKPGGRAALATWSSGEGRNPLINVPMGVLRRHMPPEPEPRDSSPSTARVPAGIPGVLGEAMQQRGFRDVTTGIVPLRLTVGESDAPAYWEERRAGSPASLEVLARLSEAQQQAVEEEVVEAIRGLIAEGRATGEMVWAAGSKT